VKWLMLHATGAEAFCHGAFQQATYFFPYLSRFQIHIIIYFIVYCVIDSMFPCAIVLYYDIAIGYNCLRLTVDVVKKK
jgi:hypothetical protein